MLTVRHLSAGYQSGSRVLDDLSLHVDRGEIVGLLGRNGVGKTTLMKAIAGLLPSVSGTIEVAGQQLAGRPSHSICRAGVGYVPQGREIFGAFTVEENLLMGLIGKRELPRAVPDWALQLFPALAERRKQRAGTLSGGQQQQLAIVRALVGRPRLLLLDEPSEGIQPSIVHQIAGALLSFARDRGLTVLLVEQNLDLVRRMASRCLFIESGRIVAEMPSEDVRPDAPLVARHLSL